MDKRIILPQEMINNLAKKKMSLADKICWVVLFIIGAYIVGLLIQLIAK